MHRRFNYADKQLLSKLCVLSNLSSEITFFLTKQIDIMLPKTKNCRFFYITVGNNINQNLDFKAIFA